MAEPNPAGRRFKVADLIVPLLSALLGIAFIIFMILFWFK
jgi:hypothetical protein